MSDTGSVFQQAISRVGEVFNGLMQQPANADNKNQSSTPNTQRVGIQLRNGKKLQPQPQLQLQPQLQSTAVPNLNDTTETMTQLQTMMGNCSMYDQGAPQQEEAPQQSRPRTQKPTQPQPPIQNDALEAAKPKSEQGNLGLEQAQNLLFGLDAEAVEITEQNRNLDNRNFDNGPAKLAEAIAILKRWEKSQKRDQEPEAPQPNLYTQNWAHQVNQTTAINASSNKSTESLAPETRRSKTLETLKKDPIDQWDGEQNLYSFLVTVADQYLSCLCLTKAETAQALSYVFKTSPYAMSEASRIAMLKLPDLATSTKDRKPTYKAIARALDTGGKASFTPLKSGERIMDLFQRTKLIFECIGELDNSKLSDKWIDERLNYLAVEKMSSREAMLLPDQDIQYLDSWWMTHHIMNQDATVADRDTPESISTRTATNMIINLDKYRRRRMSSLDEPENNSKTYKPAHTPFPKVESYKSSQNQTKTAENKCDLCGAADHRTRSCPVLSEGPCTICLENGKPKDRIFHITSKHKGFQDEEE